MSQKIKRHLTKNVPCPTPGCGAAKYEMCAIPSMRRRRDDHGNPATVYVRWLHHSRKAA